VRRLALDVDALVHARRPGLVAEIETLIANLPDRACMERSVYHRDAARSGLHPLLDGWRNRGLLPEPVDYRRLPDGDEHFRRLGAERAWRGLSREDRATLVMAMTFTDCGVLTCERLLATAARHFGLHAIDLFDVVRYALREGRLTTDRAREVCADWDRDRFSAGRPIDYCGSFDRELTLREGRNPLPF
jgi:hypothetical protein